MLRVVTLIFHEPLSGKFVTPPNPFGEGAGLGTSLISYSRNMPNFKWHTHGRLYLLPLAVI